MQMEYLAEKMGVKGNVVVLMGTLGHDAQLKRTAGVEEVAAKYPDIKIIKEQTGLWQRAMGMQVMENWLSSGDKIDAVAANNDEMAIGAINAIEAMGMGGKVLVGGVDGTPDALDLLSKGKMTVTIFQDGLGQASGAMDAVTKILAGENVEQEINIPFKLITQDNYKEFMK
jgi:inositol transport system substrate-binding protein